MEKHIILFDGVCNLCNRFVNLVISYDKKKYFKMGAIQSDEGLAILKERGLEYVGLSSVVLITPDNFYKESRAALEILKKLTGLWPMLYIFIILPPFVRDGIYRWIATNRYSWFGKTDSCRIPSPEIKDRFI